MQFSLFFFDGDGSAVGDDHYRLIQDAARFADREGLVAIWTPERHFHAFGGLYPNPALTAASLAMITENVQLRAGSVVLPLHHPVRVAEDWAVVDNLSGGRVAMAAATGWTMDEFILSSEPHGSRRGLMWRSLDEVRRLWRGEAVEFEDAAGRLVEAKTLPRPIQPELPIWITCQSAETFVEAGRLGVNILTSVLGESLDNVAEQIGKYREARSAAGHDPAAGTVSLMMHTFLGDDEETVKRDIREPFREYLKTHYGLLENLAKGMGLDVSLDDFSDDDLSAVLDFGVEGFMRNRSLIGTPEGCLPFVREMESIGIDEVCCLIDFVQDYDVVMASLPHLAGLKKRVDAGAGPTANDAA
ncbi:MAG: siderophore biosynthesis protein [Deltaproteobacteria bacterium]|nr:siderophore biosynthesis protein [Deltaproteobacteria bacterium]